MMTLETQTYTVLSLGHGNRVSLFRVPDPSSETYCKSTGACHELTTESPVSGLAFIPGDNGILIQSEELDSRISLWDLTSMTQIHQIIPFNQSRISQNLAVQSTSVAFGSADGYLSIFDMRMGALRCRQCIDGGSSVSYVMYSKHDSDVSLFCGTSDGSVYQVDTRFAGHRRQLPLKLKTFEKSCIRQMCMITPAHLLVTETSGFISLYTQISDRDTTLNWRVELEFECLQNYAMDIIDCSRSAIITAPNGSGVEFYEATSGEFKGRRLMSQSMNLAADSCIYSPRDDLLLVLDHDQLCISLCYPAVI